MLEIPMDSNINDLEEEILDFWYEPDHHRPRFFDVVEEVETDRDTLYNVQLVIYRIREDKFSKKQLGWL